MRYIVKCSTCERIIPRKTQRKFRCSYCRSKVLKPKPRAKFKSRIGKSCTYCKKDISVIKSEKTKNNFCSRECFVKYRKEQSRVWVKCINCSKKLFVLKKVHAEKLWGSCCSKDCVYEFYSGRKARNWKHGEDRKKYPASFNEKLKNLIKERDNFECQNCKDKKLLTIHHIDYDKFNNDPQNLITLCVRCNTLANTKREEKKLYYQSLIFKYVN